jgi:choline dehydrogenase-like flavoprotein
MAIKRLEEFDVVIVGGGPSGCVLAKDLAKAGKKVILIEKGGNNLKGIGTMRGMLNGEHMERAKFPNIWQTTLEGHNVVLGKGIGGGSYLYAGIVGMPEFGMFDEIGIDLRPYLEDAKKETWVSETPDEFLGSTTKHMLEVTNAIGLPFEPAHRHINFEKCKYGCQTSAFGCARGAKWMGHYAANEAVEYGATLQVYTEVKNIIVENNVAVGVDARGVKDGQLYEIRGKTVVVSAGGIGSPGILTRSGIRAAGQRLFGDPSFGSTGLLPKGGLKSHFYEHGTSISYMDVENGCMFSTNVTWSRLFWSGYQLMGAGIRGAWKVWKHYPRMVSIMNKIHDDGVGRVTYTGRVSKTITLQDEDKMNYCRYINEKILNAMGCDPGTIKHTGFSHVKGGLTFGHPGGSCPIGVVVDENLETEIKNCFVCDISSLPGAPSKPPVLTLVTLTKWFGTQLLKRLRQIDGGLAKLTKEVVDGKTKW